MTYQVIGTASQYAIVDFGCNLSRASKILKDAKFSNGLPAKADFIGGFRSKREANNFKARCESALAFASGKLGRWITPTFVVQAL